MFSNTKTSFLAEIKKLIHLAIPVIFAQLLMSSAGLVDTIMAGRHSSYSLAGVGIGSSSWLTIFLFIIGIFMAITPIVARNVGAQRYEEIAPVVHQAFWVSLFIIFVIWVIFYFRENILSSILNDKQIIKVACDYLLGIAFGVPAIIGFTILRFYNEGLSRTGPQALSALIGLFVNIFFNYLLIFGKWGLPELGGAGCGWATSISYWVMFLFMVIYTHKHQFYKHFSLYKKLYLPNKKILAELLKLGIHIGGAVFCEASVFVCIIFFLGNRPIAEINAHQITLNVESLGFMVAMGIGTAATIRVSNWLGAKNPTQAFLAGKAAIVITCLGMFSIAMFLFIFTKYIASFYTQDSATIAIAINLLWFAAILRLVDGFVTPVSGILRGYKDTKIPFCSAVLSYWIIGAPIGYILGLTDLIVKPLGAKGFWVGLTIGLIISGSLLTWRFFKIAKKTIRESKC